MKAGINQTRIEDYNYNLPKDKIAQFPLEKREESKLLLVRNGDVSWDRFYNIADHLPEKSLLVFNNTKVIPARMLFQKDTGAAIEIFCLEPVEPVTEMQNGFRQRSPVVWKCFVGNARRWKSGIIKKLINRDIGDIEITAEKKAKENNTFYIEFSWEPSDLIFSEILSLIGQVPLPPYISRAAEEFDKISYQTVYAHYDGSVAAPTAGLHFTPVIIDKLKGNGIKTANVTLHVGAGTFTPVVSDTIDKHKMHSEHIVIPKETIEALYHRDDLLIIPVGTTSVRTLESLYWFGIKINNSGEENLQFFIHQWEPYQNNSQLTKKESLELILNYMDKRKLSTLTGITQMIIAPVYDYKITDALITNFHQPRSTLLLLVAALIGDRWKEAYHYALDHDFRFLSYGDSCFFIP